MFNNSVGCVEKAVDDVMEFHRAFNHPIPKKITKLNDERKNVRAKWMREEIQEFLDSNNIHEELDAMADLCYFAFGTVVEILGQNAGEYFSHIFDLVQHANMSKLWPDGKPHYNEDNKVIKPSGWVAPDESIKKYVESIIDAESSQKGLF